ncbi:MAG: MBL fold metallo-hydrolase RNA specificity domain-containing protein [Planctomycetota bacterium]
MKLRFYGAVENTTGSMHLLEVNGARVLLECGLFQGHRKEAFEKNRNIPFEADGIDACVLSHAHIDHSGNLPNLVKSGYEGPIYATPATRDLCAIMLADSAYLQVQDVRYVNKKRKRQGKTPFEPLYTPDDVPLTMRAFRPVRYGVPAEVAPGVKLTFRDAGHILGSAFVSLDVRENGAVRRLMFTGDMGRPDMPILADPVPVPEVELLITESTYGDRLHPAEEDVKGELTELCRQITEQRGKLIIPAFSVGRTQQLLYFLNELCTEGRIEEVPVFVDSPLSTRATQVYRAHPECYDRETAELLEQGDDPFWFRCLTYTSSVEESKELNEMSGPAVVISASGMCEGGRILHHLAHGIEEERNVLLFVGYQARNTLGRRIVEGASPVRIFGDQFEVRAEVRSINALSAHADRREMLDYFESMGAESVERAFIVHGEPEAADRLAEDLGRMGAENVLRPEEATPYEV